jgi:hypothetical protein
MITVNQAMTRVNSRKSAENYWRPSGSCLFAEESPSFSRPFPRSSSPVALFFLFSVSSSAYQHWYCITMINTQLWQEDSLLLPMEKL